MINLKTKSEGSLNRPCAKHNEEQRESRRVCELQSNVDKGIPTETCIHDLKKMLIYSIIKKWGNFLSFFLKNAE